MKGGLKMELFKRLFTNHDGIANEENIETEKITDREMTTAGWVWHIDNERLKLAEQDLSLMKINLLRMIFNNIDQFSETGYYTGWVAENVCNQNGTGPYREMTTIILTSSDPLHTKEQLHQEIMKYLKTVKGYLREDGGYPLKYEGLPLLRRGENGFGFALVDENFLTRADELSKKVKSKSNNLYYQLLNSQKQD